MTGNNSANGTGMLEKGLSLLVALGQHDDQVGVTELAREVGLTVSTTHRLLSSMVPLGFVSYHPVGRKYSLGMKVFELSHQVPEVRSASEVALPVLRNLRDATGEPATLAVLDGTEMMVVRQLEGRQRIQIRQRTGQRGALYATSVGKCLLAFRPDSEIDAIISKLRLDPLGPNTITDEEGLRDELARVREQGYAVADQENEPGICAVGVPVLDSHGTAVASVCVVAPTSRSSVADLTKFLPQLRDAAQQIGAQLLRNEARSEDIEEWLRR